MSVGGFVGVGEACFEELRVCALGLRLKASLLVRWVPPV
jgi:hypothetical protein